MVKQDSSLAMAQSACTKQNDNTWLTSAQVYYGQDQDKIKGIFQQTFDEEPMPQPITDAREHAQRYREEQEDPPSKPASKPAPKPRSEQAWSDLASQRIEEALAAGVFDNLPGQGKPLDAAPEPFTPAEMQMANSLLKNNELSPAWISERKEILAAIAALRGRLADAKTTYALALDNVKDEEKRAQIDKAWQAQIGRWRQEIANLNRRIETHNLTQPITHLEIYKLVLETELAR